MRLESPLRRWDVIAGLCQSIKAKTVVEIGCKEGRLTSFLLSNFPELRIVAIDPWGQVPRNEAEDYTEWDFNEIAETFAKNIEPYVDRCEHWPLTSAHAGKMLNDPCYRPYSKILDLGNNPKADLVFIDGAHDYVNVCTDIELWWPVVAEHGFLTGHDYQHKFPGVHEAVAQHFDLLNVAVMPDSVWVVAKNGGAKL